MLTVSKVNKIYKFIQYAFIFLLISFWYSVFLELYIISLTACFFLAVRVCLCFLLHFANKKRYYSPPKELSGTIRNALMPDVHRSQTCGRYLVHNSSDHPHLPPRSHPTDIQWCWRLSGSPGSSQSKYNIGDVDSALPVATHKTTIMSVTANVQHKCLTFARTVANYTLIDRWIYNTLTIT